MYRPLLFALGILALIFFGPRLFSFSVLKREDSPSYRKNESLLHSPEGEQEISEASSSAQVLSLAVPLREEVSEKKERLVPPSIPRISLPSIPVPIPPISPIPTAQALPVIPPFATSTPIPQVKPSLPPLNPEAIFAAVVKIECPSEDRRGKYVGSGFVLPGISGQSGTVVSAAHLLMASGSETCTVIFPNKDRAPSHWLSGTISEDRAAIRRRHDEEGIDVALITLLPLTEYPEAKAVFPDGYPAVPYPVCTDPDMMGDKLFHFGYPSNFLNQSYLSKADGEAIAYADITGIETQLNQDQTETYKTPILRYITDKHNLHPYMASRVATFYGDSGGLAFNADKQCILGPQRGGTIGGGAGENVSIFALLGWPPARRLLP